MLSSLYEILNIDYMKYTLKYAHPRFAILLINFTHTL